ncbi:esterase/lipase family protein [Oryzobacter sp. R7]|uniref:esterase/lipase family protein n=1 Tax=Oryzobacter faecalis TaxID=3388656 RepID=UPI00398CF1BB
MAEQLSPEGLAVTIGEVTLTTPGLTGTAEVHPPASPGMRAAEDASGDFLEAVAEAGMSEQLTVEITGPGELDDAGGTRASGGGSEIVVEVPAPGEGNGQVLLYKAEDGSLTWHLPDDVPTDEVAQRGGARRTYRVPRAVVAPEAAEGGQRGLLGALGTKVLKVLVFPLVDPVLGVVGKRLSSSWESKHRRMLVRPFDPATHRARAVDGVDDAAWARLAAGPALLFVHGTFAMADSAFAALGDDTVAELDRRYGGRVFAFDHHTVSVSPNDNVEWFASVVPDGVHLTVDVVTHSRGGLVGRALAERGPELGLDGRLTVRNLVMVAPPNAGTALADPDHLGAYLDRITNLAQFIPSSGFGDALGLVLTIVKQLAVGATKGMPGLMSMNPSGEDLKAFNDTPGSSATYRVIAADFEPPPGSGLGRIARDRGTDVVFGSVANDLVVPTDGWTVAGAKGFPVADPFVIPASEGVDHSSFFGRADVRAKLLEWLPGA